ncbi:MAG: GxxExxY protein [Sphingobacteriales bacterium]|nr:GxxExxY protein [Sphingobacteriales bacterium]
MIVTQRYIDELTYRIIGCAIEVHRILGPGLLESVYEKCFLIELAHKGLSCKKQQRIVTDYKGTPIDTELRYDVLVENLIITELKSSDGIHPVYLAILKTYMRLLEKPKGILINFNCTHIFKEGQKTIVNEYYAALPKE